MPTVAAVVLLLLPSCAGSDDQPVAAPTTSEVGLSVTGLTSSSDEPLDARSMVPSEVVVNAGPTAPGGGDPDSDPEPSTSSDGGSDEGFGFLDDREWLVQGDVETPEGEFDAPSQMFTYDGPAPFNDDGRMVEWRGSSRAGEYRRTLGFGLQSIDRELHHLDALWLTIPRDRGSTTIGLILDEPLEWSAVPVGKGVEVPASSGDRAVVVAFERISEGRFELRAKSDGAELLVRADLSASLGNPSQWSRLVVEIEGRQGLFSGRADFSAELVDLPR